MENLICKQCKEPYDHNEKMPVMIDCGHSICKDCYVTMFDAKSNSITCPID